jgi:hypothetical protein
VIFKFVPNCRSNSFVRSILALPPPQEKSSDALMQLENSKCRWVDNIKTYVQDMKVDSIHVAEFVFSSGFFWAKVMNIWGSMHARNFRE